MGSPELAHQKLFGGIKVIICSDPHQFPPFEQAICDLHESQMRQAIYEEFETGSLERADASHW